MPRYGRDDVEVLADSIAWRGFFKIRLLKLRHRLFAGGWAAAIERELFVRGPAVGVLPYDPVQDAVLLVEQFRVGALAAPRGPWLSELVAGIIDKEETPEEVARREAEEEAGITLGELEPVAEYFSSPGGSDEYFYLFCGRCDLSGAGGIYGLPSEGEDIRAEVVPLDEALARLEQGLINNAHSLIALHWLRQHRSRLQRQWQ